MFGIEWSSVFTYIATKEISKGGGQTYIQACMYNGLLRTIVHLPV